MFDSRNLRGLLSYELVECDQSGHDVDPVREEITLATASEAVGDEELPGLYQRLVATPLRPDWPYVEPTDLSEILAATPEAPAPSKAPSGAALDDRMLAAWLGRCAGCNLGKPVEGVPWSRAEQRDFLQSVGAYPLDDYIPVPDPLPEGIRLHPSWPDAVRGRIDGMARDDDTDYTMLGLRILETYGRGYTTADVGREWLRGMPYEAVYTAERIAYGNLVVGIEPPAAASYHNPYREWIGAQIRADIFGYVSPADPAGAARLAYADAALSHTANGVYGEMWAAALIAAAFSSTSAREAVQAAMAVVPARSRLATSLQATIDAYDAGRTWEQAMESMDQRLAGYHWVHTINNAEVVVAALLWGEGDFGRTIGLAVEAALDTDCDGATAGSVFGALHGTARLPAHWTEPLHDTMHSALLGYDGSSITDLARRSAALATARLS